MYSIKELYKIGNGPSSSHTIGPLNATKVFLSRYPSCDMVKVILYGSLALTGKGHLTDYIIEKTIMPKPCKIEFDINSVEAHPNTMLFIAMKNDEEIGRMKVYSIGGGAIEIEGEKRKKEESIYPLNKLSLIIQYCKEHNLRLYEYVDFIEGDSFTDYINDIYRVMEESIDRGLNTTGILPGRLQIKRKANYIYYQNLKEVDPLEVKRRKAVAYAYAVSEENASGGEIVTAPTCGAAGVLPAVMRYAEDLER